MGQKVDPRGLRLGITRAWDSNWYADKKEYVKYFHEDVQIKEFIKKNYFHTGISKVRIERTSPSQVVVHIHTGKAGLIIGRKGAEIDLHVLIPPQHCLVHIAESPDQTSEVLSWLKS